MVAATERVHDFTQFDTIVIFASDGSRRQFFDRSKCTVGALNGSSTQAVAKLTIRGVSPLELADHLKRLTTAGFSG